MNKFKSNIYIFVWSLLMVFVLGACTDDFTQINTPSNEIVADNVGSGELGKAFAQAEYQGNLGRAIGGSFQLIHSLYGDIYAQYFATTAKNFDSDQYAEIGGWVDGGWNDFYGNAAPQLDFVLNFTADNDLPVENAIAKIYKVQFYQRITDLWGPIIYSEYGSGETSVAYDTQESIYNDFFKILGEARNTLQQTSRETAFADDDLIFDGDISKWLRFANSLQLRAAMRIRYVDPAKAQTEAEEAVASGNGGVMTENIHNATILTTPNNRNPYMTITQWGEYRMSAAMESTLEGYNDPRISEYFSPAQGGDSDGDGSPYEGFRNGIPKGDKDQALLNSSFSDMATKYMSEASGGTYPPIQVMNASEVYFLRAEGAMLGWNMGGGTAKTYYDEGIRKAMNNRTTATSSEIEAYINSTDTPTSPDGGGGPYDYNLPALSNIPVAFNVSGSDEEKLEQIITQKWLALYPNSLEAYAELRRTGYPRQYERVNSLNPNVGPGEIFRRLTFVTSEYSNNNQATTEAEGLVNGPADDNSVRVWWDAKPLTLYPDFVSPAN